MKGPTAPSTVDPVEVLLPHRIREIEFLVESLVATWHRTGPALQRRRWHRVPYEKNVAVTPWDSKTNSQAGETMLATGRDISLGGISFAHISPLPYQKVAITFIDGDDDTWDTVVTRLSWCRFTRERIYHSGGQFMHAVELNFEPNFDFNQLARI